MADTSMKAPDTSSQSDPAFDAVVRQFADLHDISTQLRSELGKSAKMRDDITSKIINAEPPKAPALPAPVPPPQPTSFRDAGQKFGGIATVLGAIGGLMSRAPLTASLNAMAGAMRGYHQADLEQYQKNYDDWKAQSDYAARLTDWQQGQYKLAMDTYRNNIDKMMAAMSTIAARDNDIVMQHTLATGDARNSLQLWEDRNNANMALKRYNLELARLNDAQEPERGLYKEWLDGNPGASPAQKVQMWHYITGASAASQQRTMQQEAASTSLQRLQNGENVQYGGFTFTPQDYQVFIATGGASSLEGNAKNHALSEMVNNAWRYSVSGNQPPSIGGSPSPSLAPPGLKAVDVPPALKNDPDGTPYTKDGVTWIKRGNKLVPQVQ